MNYSNPEHHQYPSSNEQQQHANQLTLPSFKEFVDNTFSQQHSIRTFEMKSSLQQQQQYYNTIIQQQEHLMKQKQEQYHVLFNTNNACMQSQYNSTGTNRDKDDACMNNNKHANEITSTQQQHDNSHVNILSSKITSLESKLNVQEQELSRLMNENESLKKRKLSTTIPTSTTTTTSMTTSKKKSSSKKTKTSSPPPSTDFNLILEEGLSKKYKGTITGNIEDYKVIWEEKEYIILNAFNNRDEIFNYYCPQFEIKYPDKVYRLVLERDDYKKLFKENEHLSKFFRSHAWRISIFSFEFVEFVKKSKR